MRPGSARAGPIKSPCIWFPVDLFTGLLNCWLNASGVLPMKARSLSGWESPNTYQSSLRHRGDQAADEVSDIFLARLRPRPRRSLNQVWLRLCRTDGCWAWLRFDRRCLLGFARFDHLDCLVARFTHLWQELQLDICF